jgi:hypothetical protein
MDKQHVKKKKMDKQAITPVVTACSQLDSNSWTIAFPAIILFSVRCGSTTDLWKKEFKALRRATPKNPSCMHPCDLLFSQFFI